MNDSELQLWIERLSDHWFGRPFVHRASFNAKLRSTGGRYFTGSHNIEISRKYFEAYGPEETEKVIKHELCHYHLHLMKKGFKHRDAEFRELLGKVGGTRFCKALPGAVSARPYKYKLQCMDCSMEYMRKRKVNPNRYVCGRCKGRLRLFVLDLNAQV